MAFKAKETFDQKKIREKEEVLNAKEATLRANISNERNSRLVDTGFQFKGEPVAADDTSKSNLLGYTVQASLLSYPIKWRCINNEFISLDSAEELLEFGSAMSSYIQSEYEKAWIVKDSISSATTVEQMNSFYESYLEN